MGHFAHLVEIVEQPGIEHFLAIGSIEALDERILIRFSGLNEPDQHAVAPGPLRKGLAKELRAIVHTQQIRQRTLASQLLEDADQSGTGEGGVDFDRDYFPVEVVDHVESPEPGPAIQGVAHEVGRPDLVGPIRDDQRFPLTRRQAPPGSPALIQSHRTVHPVDPLVIPSMANIPKPLVAFPEAAPRMILEIAIDRVDDRRIADHRVRRWSILGRAGQAARAAGPSDRQTVIHHQRLRHFAPLRWLQSFFAMTSFRA